jgi:hypothetical protein
MIRNHRNPSALVVAVLGLAAGLSSLAATPRPRATFKLTNTSRHVVREAYISPSNTASWGANLLGKPLRPGASVTLPAAQGCGKYDVRLVISKTTEILDEEVELCGTSRVMSIGDQALTTETRE